MKKIEVGYGFVSAACLFAWVDFQCCLWFLTAALCHELGHLAIIAVCKVPLRQIRLKAAGAVIDADFSSYGQELICALGGPVFNLTLTVLFRKVAPELAVVSVCMAVINLLPVYPMDGGRILCAFLLLHYETEKVHKILKYVSFITFGLLMFLAAWGTAVLQAGIWPLFAVLAILWRMSEAGKSE